MAELTRFKAEQNARLDNFRETLRSKHDAMLSDYRKVEEEDINALESAAQQQQAKLEGQDDAKTRLERKVKMAFGRWRIDYQGHMREKYQALVAEIKELHNKYTEVLREREHQELERDDNEKQKAKVNRMRAKLHQEEEGRLKKEARDRLEEEERRLHEGYANARRMEEAKDKIHSLWDALEVDPGERHGFYRKVLAQNTNMEVVKLCQVECGRMGRQLPLVQLITKVEALKAQLDSLRKGIKEAALAGTSPSQIREKDREKEGLVDELADLSHRLRIELEEYESETGQTFLVNGKPYALATRSPKALTDSSRSSERRRGQRTTATSRVDSRWK